MVVEAEENGKVVFIELKQSDNGDFYTVNSAFPTPRTYAEKKERKEGWVKLWDRMALQSSAPAAQSPSAGQPSSDAGESAAPPSGQSTPTVAPSSDQGNAKPDPIRDVGEKIGGARKDVAGSSDKGRSAKPKSKFAPH